MMNVMVFDRFKTQVTEWGKTGLNCYNLEPQVPWVCALKTSGRYNI